MMQVWGALVIFVLCPLLGGLPLIQWIVYSLTQRNLAKVGTGNISVSAAFYHGGTFVGILAVLSEAFKGIAAVLLARFLFPTNATWEIIALIALVLGRYWIGRGAGTTNVVWGVIIHDWITAGLVLLLGGIGFTLLRERRSGRLGVLGILALITILRYPQDANLILATLVLCGLMGWIYQMMPDDLDLPNAMTQGTSRKVFRFFQGDRSLLRLDQPLPVNKVGQKAATLSQLKHWGYPVPSGWVLPPGDDPGPLIETVQPSTEMPLIVRSSAIGEDSETASAAGQYRSILHITTPDALEQAIFHCQSSYNLPRATRYRQDRGLAETGMAALVQVQVQGVFSGVAFSRDPVARQGDAVVIEALPGMALQVVSGQVTPEQYRVQVSEASIELFRHHNRIAGKIAPAESWKFPSGLELSIEGKGQVPSWLIQQVAYLARDLEVKYHGVPQDVEWSYDGQQLWILQSRPITTLLPIWTRKIAAEVIPGKIHPLTWSVNRPLTCGVWGEIFTTVLGDRARGLDFNQTATLHHSAAYFNASLLGQIFQRMGLPTESLEFLTRGAKFNRPPLHSTLRNLPGLLKLAQQELQLEKAFEQATDYGFNAGFDELEQHAVDQLPPDGLLRRIYRILKLLKQATYYSIMAPLSLALRRALLKVPEHQLDNGSTPEIAAIRSLQVLAMNTRSLLVDLDSLPHQSQALFDTLAQSPQGQSILWQFDQFLEKYGYLSEVGTDIAVPTWKEDPQPVRELFTQFLLNPPHRQGNSPPNGQTTEPSESQNWKTRQVQRRLTLKGEVTTVYSRLLAELRWSFVALETYWRSTGLLSQPGDIFFLTFEEIEQLVTHTQPELEPQIPRRIAQRRWQLEHNRQLSPPLLVYGNDPPLVLKGGLADPQSTLTQSAETLQGIGASPGQIEGQIQILKTLQPPMPEITKKTILVVPYTDSGWGPLLAQAGGLVAEVGGQLSHGAIVAREYGIPAVMDIYHATQRLRDGQRVRLDGERGTVEILE
jgi:pyruvate,water dikinase